MAAADSTHAAVLYTVHDVILPFSFIYSGFPVSRFTVSCSFPIAGAGLTAALKTTGIPLAIPPRMPPWLFEDVLTLPSSSNTKVSLFSEPERVAPVKPLPNSTPLIPGMAKTACPMRLLRLSKKLSPQEPGSRPMTAHSMTPPTESSSAAADSIISSKARGFLFPPISEMSERTSAPFDARICFAMPPAMQRPRFSSAENLPSPSRSASFPSFMTAAKSAQPGRGSLLRFCHRSSACASVRLSPPPPASSAASGHVSITASTVSEVTMPSSPPKPVTPFFQIISRSH